MSTEARTIVPPQRAALRSPTLAVSCVVALVGCTSSADAPDTVAADGFVHVEAGRVVDASGRPLWLRGVNFGDWFREAPEVWLDSHDERDYERAREMGMNVVRLLVNYQLFEDETGGDAIAERGLAWLDQNVEWARKHGMFLVPSLSIPPAGSPKDCGNDTFWNEAEYQDRFVAFWQGLAARYANEKAIAGYSLLDVVNPSESLDQWRELAERTTTAIREVDENHMLFVGRALSIACVFDKPAEDTFIRLTDPNVVYEFDRTQPWGYVAQLLEQSGLPEYGPYPDPGLQKWLHGSWDSRPGAAELYLEPGKTEWTERRFYYTVTDSKFELANPCLQSDKNSGTAYFDDIVIKEYDENGEFLRVVKDLDLEDLTGWRLWEGDAEGVAFDGPGVAATEPDAHRGEASISLTGTTTLANLSNDQHKFAVTLGHTYEVTGWMKGKNSAPEGASMIRLDFLGTGAGAGSEGFGRTALEALFTDFVGWADARGVPLNVNAFGTGRPTFEANRGGLAWTTDMIDIMVERNLHFTYYAYHQRDWGIYGNAVGLPDPATVNQPLVDLLTKKLR